MKSFTFKLEKVLKQREKEEKEYIISFTPLVKEYNEMIAKKEEIERNYCEYLKAQKNIFNRREDNFMNKFSQMSQSTYLLKNSLKEQEKNIKKIKEELEEKQKELVQKNAKKKAIEILKDKAYKEWKKKADNHYRQLMEEQYMFSMNNDDNIKS